MTNDPIYETCRTELKDLVDQWVRKWCRQSPHSNPNHYRFDYTTIERILLENLYDVHSEICCTV